MEGGTEPNRTWTFDLPPSLGALRCLPCKFRSDGKPDSLAVSDTTYLHLNLGLFCGFLDFGHILFFQMRMGLRTVIALIYGKVASSACVGLVGQEQSIRSVNINDSQEKVIAIFLSRQIKHWVATVPHQLNIWSQIGVARDRILQIQNCVCTEATNQAVPAGAK